MEAGESRAQGDGGVPVPLPGHVTAAVKILARRVGELARVEEARRRLAALAAMSSALAADEEGLLADLCSDRVVARAAVRAYGVSLRDEGVRPEHLVSAARVVIPLVAPLHTSHPSMQLESAVVTWVIEGYYFVA